MINELVFKGEINGVEPVLIKSRTINKLLFAVAQVDLETLAIEAVYRDDTQSISISNDISAINFTDISDFNSGYSRALHELVGEVENVKRYVYFEIDLGSLTLTDDAQLEVMLKGTTSSIVVMSALQGAEAPLKVLRYEKVIQSNVNFSYPVSVFITPTEGFLNEKSASVVVRSESNQGTVDIQSILANTYTQGQIEYSVPLSIGLLYNLNAKYEVPEIVNINCTTSGFAFIGVTYADIKSSQLNKVALLAENKIASKMTALAQRSPAILKQVVERETY